MACRIALSWIILGALVFSGCKSASTVVAAPPDTVTDRTVQYTVTGTPILSPISQPWGGNCRVVGPPFTGTFNLPYTGAEFPTGSKKTLGDFPAGSTVTMSQGFQQARREYLPPYGPYECDFDLRLYVDDVHIATGECSTGSTFVPEVLECTATVQVVVP